MLFRWAGATISCGAASPRVPVTQGADISTAFADTLTHPPLSLLQGASLFLDFDGTLVELIDRPDAVMADPELLLLLGTLDRHLDGRVAIISGRSLAQLDAMLGPIAQKLALSGSHGGEFRWPGVTDQPERGPSLDEATRHLKALANRYPGAILEEKSFGVAIHYRRTPDAEPAAVALGLELARDPNLAFQQGKMMVELRVAGSDKGKALHRLMTRPEMRGTRPLFLGDDLTDEPALDAASALGGAGILVGPARATAARYSLPDPGAVRAWLAEAAQ